MKSNIKIGSVVTWTCTPSRMDSFKCKGKVESLKKSTFGGSKKGIGARIKVTSTKYLGLRRSHAFISVENITFVK